MKDVVTGERPWADLNDFGVTVHVGDSGVSVISAHDPVRVTAPDIARGWLRYSSHEKQLRSWARLIHGAVGLFDLDVDANPWGEELLDGLWRVSFGEPVVEHMHDIARRVLISSPD